MGNNTSVVEKCEPLRGSGWSLGPAKHTYTVVTKRGWFSTESIRYERDHDGKTIKTNNYDYKNDKNEIVYQRERHNLDYGAKKRVEIAYKKREGIYDLGKNNCQHSSRDAFNAATGDCHKKLRNNILVNIVKNTGINYIHYGSQSISNSNSSSH